MWNFNCVHCNLQLTRPCPIVSHLVPILNVLGFADLGEGYGHWWHLCNITTQTWPPTLPKILLCLPLVLLFSVFWENVDVQIARQKFSQFSCSFLFFFLPSGKSTSLGGTKYCWLCCLFVCFTNARCLIEGEGKGRAKPIHEFSVLPWIIHPSLDVSECMCVCVLLISVFHA